MNNEMSIAFKSIRLHPSGMQFLADHGLLTAADVALFAVAGYDGLAYAHFKPWILAGAAILLLFLLYRYMYVTRIVYVIGDEQLKYQEGIFTETKDFIELYRVVDYSEQRSFLQILFGLKTVSIYSGDRTRPRLDMIGIDNDMDLISEIRQRVEYNKTRRNIHEFTNTK